MEDEDEDEEEMQRRRTKEQRMQLEDMSEKCLQKLAEENRMEMVRYEAQEKMMMLPPFAKTTEAPLLELEHRVPDFLLVNEKATAARIEDLDAEKHYESSAM